MESWISREITEYNRKNKGEMKLRKCIKCLNFNKSVYQCKLKKCDKK